MLKRLDEKYSRMLLNANIKLIAIIPMILLILLQVAVCHLDMVEVIYFAAAIFFNVFIVGAAIVSLLSLTISKFEYYVYSMVFGVSYVIALYFIVYPLMLSHFLVYFTTSFTIIALFILNKNKEKVREYKNDSISRSLFWGLTVIIILVMMLGNSFVNLTPQYTLNQEYFSDNMWNIGNITMAYNSFPMSDIRIEGIDFYYHFFTQIFLSVMKSITGIDSFSIYFYYYPFIIAPMIVGSFIIFARRFLKSNMALTLAFLAFITAYRSAVDTLFYPYNGPLSYVFLFLSGSFFLRSVSSIKTKIIDKNIVLAAVLLIFATGSKGPYAAIFLVGYGVALFISYFTERNIISTTVRGLVLLTSFVVPYFYLFTSIYGPGTILKIVPGFSADSLWNTGWKMIVNSLSGILVYNGAAMLVAIVVYAIVMMTIVTIPIFMLKRLIVSTERKVKYFFAYGVLVTGLVLSNVVAQESNSNQYFYYAAVPVGAIIFFGYIERNFIKRIHLKNIKTTAFVAISSLLLLITCFDIALTSSEYFKTGISNAGYSISRYFVQSDATSNEGDFSDYMYEAAIYIRDNTSEQSLILTDKHKIDDLANSYYYTAFTERQFLIEGYYYAATKEFSYEDYINGNYYLNEDVFEGDITALEKVAVMGYGEIYMIIEKEKLDNIEDIIDNLSIVYENPQIAVYQVVL